MTSIRLLCIFVVLLTFNGYSATRTIHVFVALCDNVHQGIVPVPTKIGDGKNPKTNLYWGAGYGVKSFFHLKTTDWKLVGTLPAENPHILERVVFKHATKDVYLLADAYDGEHIKACIEAFLKASNGQDVETISVNDKTLSFGGGSQLVSYIGHDGLMEFNAEVDYVKNDRKIDAIILACYSKNYFQDEIRQAGANPILWTTHLMAPEAYTLKAAIDGWLNGESGAQIDERAAQTYNTYQKCGIKGARNLFTTGF